MEISDSQSFLEDNLENLHLNAYPSDIQFPELCVEDLYALIVEMMDTIIESVHRVVDKVENNSLEEVYQRIMYEDYRKYYSIEALSFLKENYWERVEGIRIVNFEENIFCYLAVGKNIIVQDEHGTKRNQFCTIYFLSHSIENEYYSAMDFFEFYVNQLKKIAARKPYCIISVFRGELLTSKDIFKLRRYDNKELMNRVKKFSQLTDEVEKIDVPLIALLTGEVSDVIADLFLAFTYRIALDYEEIIMRVSEWWKHCFLVGGILRRLAFFSSPIVALNFLADIFENKKTDELVAIGIIDEIYTQESDGKYVYDRELTILSLLDKVLEIPFKKIRKERESNYEKRFLKIEPISPFWNLQLQKMLKINKQYEKSFSEELFEESVSYLQKIRTYGLQNASYYEAEIAVKLRRVKEKRMILDVQSIQRKQLTNKMKNMVFIGSDDAEYIASFIYCTRMDVKVIRNCDSVVVNEEIVKAINTASDAIPIIMVYDGTFAILKDADIIIISHLVGQYESVHEMLNDIEDVVRPDVPICIGFCEIDLKSVQNVARHPERIFGLHLFFFNKELFVANLITIDSWINSSTLLKKIKGTMLPGQLYVHTIFFESSGFLFLRIMLSILSEMSHQITEGAINKLEKIAKNLKSIGVANSVFDIIDYVGISILLKFAKMFQPFNERNGIKWNLDLLELLVSEYGGKILIPSNDGSHSFPDVTKIVATRSDRKAKKYKPKVLCERLMLSFLNEPIRWCVENKIKQDANILNEINHAIPAVFFFDQVYQIGVFRFIDENLYKYSDVINKGGEYYRFLKERLESVTKFFSETPVHKPREEKKVRRIFVDILMS